MDSKDDRLTRAGKLESDALELLEETTATLMPVLRGKGGDKLPRNDSVQAVSLLATALLTGAQTLRVAAWRDADLAENQTRWETATERDERTAQAAERVMESWASTREPEPLYLNVPAFNPSRAAEAMERNRALSEQLAEDAERAEEQARDEARQESRAREAEAAEARDWRALNYARADYGTTRDEGDWNESRGEDG